MARGGAVNLTEDPEVITRPEMHYVFVERVGPFVQNAGAAWQEAHKLAPALRESNQVTGYMALYKMGPKIYRAGFSLAAEPVTVPEGMKYERVRGGKYLRFVLTGPYTDLPQASGRAWGIVGEKKVEVRDDFAIENYLNDPKVTPADQLITHIMIPTV
jgi:effector-binding domain-containing protein